MKRIYAAAGAAVLTTCLVAGGWFFSHRSHPAPSTAATPVYAYADLEHVVMSHPRYSEYHHLELEYNAMVAQYQFEQWNYSQKAAAEGRSVQNFAAADAAGSAALDQELQAKVALKQNELNNRLKQRRPFARPGKEDDDACHFPGRYLEDRQSPVETEDPVPV